MTKLAVTDDEFESILNQSVVSPSSHFTILIWVSVFLAALALSLLLGWYCLNRRRYHYLRRKNPADENPISDSSFAMNLLLKQHRQNEQKQAQKAVDDPPHSRSPPPPTNEEHIYTTPPLTRPNAVPLSCPNYHMENSIRAHPPLPAVPTHDSQSSLDEISRLARDATAPPCPHISTFPYYRHPDCHTCRMTT